MATEYFWPPSASSGGAGTVTSVALTVPSFLAVSGSPITTSGTLAVTLQNENANLVFAGPATGSPDVPTFRSLVAADLPALDYATIELDNLGTTSINASLLFDADDTYDIGSSSNMAATINTHAVSANASNLNLFGANATLNLGSGALIFNSAATGIIRTASSGAGASESMIITTGGAGSGEATGNVTVRTANNDQLLGTGSVSVFSGNGTGGGDIPSGAVSLFSGSAAAAGAVGLVTIRDGVPADGAGGGVLIKTSAPSGSGTRAKIQLQDGSEGTSGQVWTSTDTVGSGHWAAPAGGGANTALSNIAAVAASAVITGQDGTDALPAFSFISDPNTGMYNYAANKLGFTTNGTNRVTVDANGFLPEVTNNYSNGTQAKCWSECVADQFNAGSTGYKAYSGGFGANTAVFRDGITTPSGVTAMGLRANPGAAAQPLALSGGDDEATSNATAARNILIEAQNKTAGTGNGGDIQLFPGTSSGGNAGRILVPQTITGGGTTGNQTINKISGTVNFAAAASSITVTNSCCSTSSIVFAVVRTNDTSATIKNVVPGAGSFVITLTAGATAETSVGFLVMN